MCGLAGFLDERSGLPEAELLTIAKRMSDALAHRGPDADGQWAEAESGLALAHRRLAIVDLSPLGQQPMHSSCGRYVIAYNGEVYNFAEMREELKAQGRTFRSHSDTEVILEGAAVWGLEETLSRLIGMFAVALWDRRDKVLKLARDRLGIKPLYVGRFGGLTLFGSELKALTAHKGWVPEIEPQAVPAYLNFGYIPAPFSIYRNVTKLAPGTVLTIRPGAEPQEHRIWSAEAVVAEGIRARENFSLSDEEATDQLEALLKDAVGRRMVADVPLGAFLSGGIDSSVVVALMQAQSGRPVKTFSIGFHVDGYNEAEHAKAVADHLGTDHTELYVDPAHALEIVPKLPEWYDEPFADSSQIPTFLVSEMTRKHVTVSLSGDGGDELFAGYNRYTLAQAYAKRIGGIPMPLRKLGAGMMRALSPQSWDVLASPFPKGLLPGQFGDKMHKLAGVITQDEDAFYRRIVSQWDQPELLMADGRTTPKGLLNDPAVRQRVPNFLDRMQYLDLMTYLPDDILTKVDRASMAVALEARVPLIDHRVVSFAWGLPQHFKIRDGQTKWLLRQVLYRHVPRSLIDRPKMGFGVPIDSWLRGPLRGWAEELLSAKSLEANGLNPALVKQRWAEHQSGKRNWQYPLWTVLMLQAWMAKQV